MGRVTSHRPRSITKPSWIATATASDVSAEPAQAVTAPPKRAPSLNAGGLSRLAARLRPATPIRRETKDQNREHHSYRADRPAAAVAAFAISVVVGGHWWETPPPPPTVDVPAVGKQVVGLLRDQWNTSDALREYGITVDDGMTLINTDLNKYDGLATVRTRKGTQSSCRSPCGLIPRARCSTRWIPPRRPT